jgi:hypothetical protein
MVLNTLLGEAVDRDLNPSEFKKRWRRGEFFGRGARWMTGSGWWWSRAGAAVVGGHHRHDEIISDQ